MYYGKPFFKYRLYDIQLYLIAVMQNEKWGANMEGKSQLGGYLQAMGALFPPSQISPSLDCIDFENTGDVKDSIKKYLIDNWYDFGMSPDEWKKYPGESFKHEIEKRDFRLVPIYDWESSLEESLNNFLPEVYSQNKNEENEELVQINHLTQNFMYMLKDEFEDMCINRDEIKVMRFDKNDYDFLRHYFCWILFETYIIATNKKVYLIYWGLDD